MPTYFFDPPPGRRFIEVQAACDEDALCEAVRLFGHRPSVCLGVASGVEADALREELQRTLRDTTVPKMPSVVELESRWLQRIAPLRVE